MPTRLAAGGVRVPDLHLIADDAWTAVLTPLPEAQRIEAALNPNLRERGMPALDLAFSMGPSATDRARSSIDDPIRVPVPRPGRRRSPRQVNVRVTDTEYEDLAVAAHLLGARPAQLARMFVLSGTRRALADRDADR